MCCWAHILVNDMKGKRLMFMETDVALIWRYRMLELQGTGMRLGLCGWGLVLNERV